MVIHFDSDPGQRCDNCDAHCTLMHLTCGPSGRGFDLCEACFSALARALRQAARKLGTDVD
jgi:imidazoleglycerol phosphate dehydratase HisB